MGHLQLPEGKKIAVNLGTDFDAQCLWMGGFNRPSPSYMSRGEFGAEVGVPRLLSLYERYDIRTTWFTPGHSVDTFSEACKRILDHGHEFGHHGYYHENPMMISPETERRLVDLAFESFDKVLGVRPVGYRSPYWDYSESTLDILEDSGMIYDSSLMGRDFHPYHPQRWQIRWEEGNRAGRASRVLEIPVSWYLDDFPPLAYTGTSTGMQDSGTILQRWKDVFDFAYHREQNPVYAATVHPQIIGQPHHFMWYEELIEYISGHEGVWFTTLEEIAKVWVPDETDEVRFELPDIRTEETTPVESGWV